MFGDKLIKDRWKVWDLGLELDLTCSARKQNTQTTIKRNHDAADFCSSTFILCFASESEQV